MDVKDRFILDKILEEYGNAKDPQLTVLQRVQEVLGYVGKEYLEYVSEKGGFPLSELYGVISFYSFFKLSPSGKYPIKVCSGTACHVKGSDLILQELENQLNIKPGETTKDGLFSLEVVRCLGCCGLSPAIVVGSNTYGNVKSSTVNKILKEYRRTENASE
jgi:NADH-quinone oxidoreductase subunit E/NADP-reducing hydrogenase subunit HndA